MPMRDASAVGTKTTLALSGSLGTTVNSTALDLVTAKVFAVPLAFHVYLPSNPTGTTPAIKLTVQESSDNSTFVDLGVLAQNDTGTTGFPKEKHQFFAPTRRYVRISATLANTDNVYGTITFWVTATAEEQRSWP